MVVRKSDNVALFDSRCACELRTLPGLYAHKPQTRDQLTGTLFGKIFPIRSILLGCIDKYCHVPIIYARDFYAYSRHPMPLYIESFPDRSAPSFPLVVVA